MPHHHIGRRQALRALAGATLVACPICQALAEEKKADAHGGAHWTYEGERGPETWGDLSADFRACSLGLEQTPIDLKGTITAQTGLVEASFQPMPLTILNNGHTIQVNLKQSNKLTLNGTEFNVAQFHFHRESEHKVNGESYDMEMHIVHQDPVTSNLVVIGIFLKEGDANPFLEKIWSLMPTVENKESISTDSINLIDAFPSDKKYYTYTGSLTTPPCSQGIDWIIIKEPMEISSEQIKKFSDIHPDNSRPTQPLNNREVIEGI